MEVPEIEEGIVEIKGVAREPGHRSKIAVSSNEPGVDPVGRVRRARRARACAWSSTSSVARRSTWCRGPTNPAELVANALQPAKVKEVRIDPDSGTAMVIVPDYQLSLAIGKEGQNARLAARLTGWRIDIKSEIPGGRRPGRPPAGGVTECGAGTSRPAATCAGCRDARADGPEAAADASVRPTGRDRRPIAAGDRRRPRRVRAPRSRVSRRGPARGRSGALRTASVWREQVGYRTGRSGEGADVRVHELAKELGVSSKELLAALERDGRDG